MIQGWHRWLILIAASLLVFVIATIPPAEQGGSSAQAHSTTDAGMPCTFSSGQVLTAACLNSNFNHLHNTFAAGITDDNISSSAAISHSKLKDPDLVPKAWAHVNQCNASDPNVTSCTISAGNNVTSVKPDSGTGTYKVQLSYTPVDTNYGVLVTALDNTPTIGHFYNLATTNPHIKIQTYDVSITALRDSSFTLVVFDDN